MPGADPDGIPQSAPRGRGRGGSTPGRRARAPPASAVPVFALIEQPRLGWSSPAVIGPFVGGVAAARRCSRLRGPRRANRCCRYGCSAAATSRPATSRPSRCTRASAILFFFLVLFLQQIGGYTPLKSGLATLPVTLVMFCSRAASARSPTATGRACSWAPVRSSRPSACSVPAPRARASTTSPKCSPRSSCSRSACRDGRTADRRGARRLRGRGGHRLGRQQCVARVAGLLGPPPSARPSPRLQVRARRNLAGLPSAPAAGPAGQAKRLPLGRPTPRRPPVGRRDRPAAEAASLNSFHLGLGDRGGACRRWAAWSGSSSSATRAHDVRAEEWPGGQLVGVERQPEAEPASRLDRRCAGLLARLACVLAHRLDDRRQPPAALGQAVLDGRGARGQTVRARGRPASRSRRRSESIRGEMPATASANSLKRSAPVRAA